MNISDELKLLRLENRELKELCDLKQKTIDRQIMRTAEWQMLIDGYKDLVKRQSDIIKELQIELKISKIH